MKLSNRLLFLFCSLFFTQFCIGKSVFPARGFSSILDESEANKRLNKFRQVFFTDHKNIPFHQGYIYQFQFIHYPRSGQPIIEYGLLSGPSPGIFQNSDRSASVYPNLLIPTLHSYLLGIPKAPRHGNGKKKELRKNTSS